MPEGLLAAEQKLLSRTETPGKALGLLGLKNATCFVGSTHRDWTKLGAVDRVSISSNALSTLEAYPIDYSEHSWWD